MNDVLQGILLLMGLLGVLSLFLSIFLVVNTVSALLTQQKRQIGVMKAVGGSTLQILGMYLVMVLCLRRAGFADCHSAWRVWRARTQQSLGGFLQL